MTNKKSEAMGSGEGKTVCVTGASGYIASWLTKHLLERGYTVRATVRNLNDEKKTAHLLALDGARERLQLFEADLLKDGSFDSAINGCEGVFHTASPCYYDCKDPQAELIDPAVKGTVNVLTSCAKSPSMKRVVLTSSTVTMMFNRRPQTPDTIADESWFADLEFCKEKQLWYAVAKILAEEAAWKFAKEKGIDMVTAHPGLVVGPMLQPTLNFSSGVIASFINNVGGDYGDTSMEWINVRDVARGHVLLFENPSASGRYALVESVAYFSEVMSIIHELYPTLRLPNKNDSEGIVPNMPPTSKEKMKELGMDSYIPFKVGLKETIESLKENKFITI